MDEGNDTKDPVDEGREQAAEPKQPDEPAKDEASAGATVVPDASAQPVASETPEAPVVPAFLSREEYEKVGDDPEPLPRGFEVIDGTGAMPRITEEMAAARAAAERPARTAEPAATQAAAQAATANPIVSSAPQSDTSPAAQAAPRDGEANGDGAQEGEPDPPSPLAAIGTFISTGADAVRQVSAAKRAHDEARADLEDLDREIGDREAELEHRRDVEGRYTQIITDETARQDSSLEAASQAKAAQDTITAAIAELKARLQQEKDDDAQTEKRLRAAVDAAEAKEASARESGSRLQRRLDDATRGLDKAQDERKSAIDAAQKSIDSANARLGTLREEFAGLQRNPSANSAEYSVRTNQLQSEISDAMEELRQAQSDLPRIKAEVERNVSAARAAVDEAQKPIDAAKQAFREVTAEADSARDELDTAKRDAAERQRALRDQISEQEKALKEQRQAAEAAQADADDAQASIDEANEIHEHPEITEQLADRLDEDRRVRADKAAQVERLAAAEQEVRDRTRGSRLTFIGAIAAVVVAIALIVIVWLALTR